MSKLSRNSVLCVFTPYLSSTLITFFFISFSSFWSFSAFLHASTHIKWRAVLRFQFRTNLWCCRPPTRSAVAEGTQGSPITALYANVLAPGQQRGHAGTWSLFMQISGRQSRHNTKSAIDTGGHISQPAQKLVWEKRGKHEKCGLSGEIGRREWQSQGGLEKRQHYRCWWNIYGSPVLQGHSVWFDYSCGGEWTEHTFFYSDLMTTSISVM